MLAINLRPALELTNEEFEQICRSNPELRLERNAQGELIAMSAAGSESSRRNADILIDLGLWNRQTQLGITFDSSAGFTLPNGAIRSPDASWIAKDRWNALPPEQRRRFAPICPDFVVELKSPSDTWEDLQKKMVEYLDNGAQLGWLIDPDSRKAEVYRAGEPATPLQNPATLSGEAVLPEFVLNLEVVWG
ncbi:MAG TPA: Uma2 family endonuclease [Trichocoleus sp.]